MHLYEYQTEVIAFMALIAAIALVWLVHTLFTDPGRHAKTRREARHDRADLAELIQDPEEYAHDPVDDWE